MSAMRVGARACVTEADDMCVARIVRCMFYVSTAIFQCGWGAEQKHCSAYCAAQLLTAIFRDGCEQGSHRFKTWCRWGLSLLIEYNWMPEDNLKIQRVAKWPRTSHLVTK
eukprot:1436275-Rhodomonas_salina.1